MTDHGHAHDDGHGHDHAHGHGAEHGHGEAPAGAHAGEEAHEEHHAAEPEVVDRKPLGPARKQVEVGDITFSLIDEGSGPPVVFLHGFPTSASLWRHVIADLSKTHRCIAPDLPGFGDTECPIERDFACDAQADAVLALLDALGLEGEVALVGHDVGTAVAQVIAATKPERLSRLVLLNGPVPGSELPDVIVRLVRGARFSFVWDLLADTGFLRWFARSGGGFRAGAYDPESLTDEAILEYIRPIYKDTPPAYRAGRERFRRALTQFSATEGEILAAVEEDLKRFEKPTLVVWGCDDPYFSVSWGKKLADLIPGCAGFELIPFCGHWVPEEKPAVLASLIASHLGAPGATPAPAVAGAAT